MSIYDAEIRTLQGEPADLNAYRDRTVLIVNVASRCGLTPQYEGLERLHESFEKRGFSVLGFPCNQFREQEPGTPDEIATFCSATYGVTFPMFEKIEVNGEGRHPLYQTLTTVPDKDKGEAGDIRWNFEKFLVAPGARTITRFSPLVTPDDPVLVEAIEQALSERRVPLGQPEGAVSERGTPRAE